LEVINLRNNNICADGIGQVQTAIQLHISQPADEEEEGDIAGAMKQDASVLRSKEKSWAACSFHLGSQVPSEIKT
jgi:hypothetical protein